MGTGDFVSHPFFSAAALYLWVADEIGAGRLASLLLAKGKSPLPAGCMQCPSGSAMHGHRAYNCALTK